MFKQLRWKYQDLRRWLGETAVIADVDTGFTWGEVVGTAVILVILLTFTVGFVIGPGAGPGNSGGESDVSSESTSPSDPAGGGADGPADETSADGDETGAGGSAENDTEATSDGGGGTTDADGSDAEDGGDDGTATDGGNDAATDAENGSADTDGGSDGFDRAAFEEAVHGFVNRERRDANVTALETEEALRTAARAHSGRMAERDEVTHEIPDGVGFEQRYREAGAETCRSDGNYTGGENVAKTYFDVQLESGERFRDEGALAGHVVDAWMDRGSTRGNVLAAGFRYEAVGAAHVEETGAVYVTQNLC